MSAIMVAPVPPPVPDPPAPAPATTRTGPGSGAPSDAEVRRELAQALGVSGSSDLTHLAELTPDGLAAAPPRERRPRVHGRGRAALRHERGDRPGGSRWQPATRSVGGFTARHPAGL